MADRCVVKEIVSSSLGASTTKICLNPIGPTLLLCLMALKDAYTTNIESVELCWWLLDYQHKTTTGSSDLKPEIKLSTSCVSTASMCVISLRKSQGLHIVLVVGLVTTTRLTTITWRLASWRCCQVRAILSRVLELLLYFLCRYQVRQ